MNGGRSTASKSRAPCTTAAANLQPPEVAANQPPQPDLKSALAAAGHDHLGERQLRPAVAARAAGFEAVAVLEQAGEGAEVDHARA